MFRGKVPKSLPVVDERTWGQRIIPSLPCHVVRPFFPWLQVRLCAAVAGIRTRMNNIE